jgi:hypothetical protein
VLACYASAVGEGGNGVLGLTAFEVVFSAAQLANRVCRAAYEALRLRGPVGTRVAWASSHTLHGAELPFVFACSGAFRVLSVAADVVGLLRGHFRFGTKGEVGSAAVLSSASWGFIVRSASGVVDRCVLCPGAQAVEFIDRCNKG